MLPPNQRMSSVFFTACFGRLSLFRVAVTWLLFALAQSSHASDTVAGEVLVKLRNPAALPPIIALYPGTVSTQFGSRPIYRLKLPAGAVVDSVVNTLGTNPDVLLVEPNITHQSPEARKILPWTIGSPTAYQAQWAPAAMRLPEAHLFSKGAGVRVAVLDTGVDATHPALAGRLLPGYDFVDDDTDASEVGTPCPLGTTTGCNLGFGHGTHVAGLIALAAPSAKIIPYRVLDPDGVGNAWVLAEALQKAIDPDGNPATDDGAHVINMSLGTLTRTKVVASILRLFQCEPPDSTDPILDFSDSGYDSDKTRCATSSGPVIVAAAGNEGSASANEYPAAENEKGLISVGASNSSTQLASFSNSGSWVQIAAPGEGITSAVPPNALAPQGYAVWSGTSMAAPLVSGAAALLRSKQPNLLPKDVVRQLTATATPLAGTATGGHTNINQVNAAALVEVCQMDVDGDGLVLPTTDGLILMRAMMGMKDMAVSSAAAPGALRATWTDIRRYLVDVCGMNLP